MKIMQKYISPSTFVLEGVKKSWEQVCSSTLERNWSRFPTRKRISNGSATDQQRTSCAGSMWPKIHEPSMIRPWASSRTSHIWTLAASQTLLGHVCPYSHVGHVVRLHINSSLFISIVLICSDCWFSMSTRVGTGWLPASSLWPRFSKWLGHLLTGLSTLRRFSSCM